MFKKLNFENSRWRTDLHRNVMDIDATIYCYGRGLSCRPIGAIACYFTALLAVHGYNITLKLFWLC